MKKTPQRQPEPAPDAAHPAPATETRRARLVSCYNCHAETLLKPFARQRCETCSVVLNPVPEWAQKHGWPEKPVPRSERRRLHYRAPVGIKKVQFRTADEHAVARYLEDVQKESGVAMNDLLLSIFSDWLEQTLGPAPGARADEPGQPNAALLSAVEASA